MKRAVVLLVVLAACGTAGASVSPGFKSAIDALEANGDCASLQARFDDTNDVDEMQYVDAALDSAGCYD